MKWNKILVRTGIYLIGLLFLAAGVVFSVNSDLGVSPVNSLPYVISLISGVNLGTCVTCVFCIYIFIQILILRKQFRWINLTQIVFSALFGELVDWVKGIAGDFSAQTYVGKTGLLGISIVLVAIGVSLYMGAGLINMPMEGMTAAIASKYPGKPFHEVKVLIDCFCVGTGIVLSLVFSGGLYGIREGTIISAVITGKIIPYVNRVTIPIIRSFISDEE